MFVLLLAGAFLRSFSWFFGLVEALNVLRILENCSNNINMCLCHYTVVPGAGKPYLVNHI